MGAHAAPYGGAPLVVGPTAAGPDFVGFYRWHVLDPVMFERELRVTIQQIGAATFTADESQEFEEYAAAHPVAGTGWMRDLAPGVHAFGIVERVDDYCATAFVYCAEAQPVPPLTVDDALADIERRDYEVPLPMEGIANLLAGPG